MLLLVRSCIATIYHMMRVARRHDAGAQYRGCKHLTQSEARSRDGEALCWRRRLAILGDLMAWLEADRAVERNASDVVGVVADDGRLHPRRAHAQHALVHQRAGQPAPLE